MRINNDLILNMQKCVLKYECVAVPCVASRLVPASERPGHLLSDEDCGFPCTLPQDRRAPRPENRLKSGSSAPMKFSIS